MSKISEASVKNNINLEEKSSVRDLAKKYGNISEKIEFLGNCTKSHQNIILNEKKPENFQEKKLNQKTNGIRNKSLVKIPVKDEKNRQTPEKEKNPYSVHQLAGKFNNSKKKIQHDQKSSHEHKNLVEHEKLGKNIEKSLSKNKTQSQREVYTHTPKKEFDQIPKKTEIPKKIDNGTKIIPNPKKHLHSKTLQENINPDKEISIPDNSQVKAGSVKALQEIFSKKNIDTKIVCSNKNITEKPKKILVINNIKNGISPKVEKVPRSISCSERIIPLSNVTKHKETNTKNCEELDRIFEENFKEKKSPMKKNIESVTKIVLANNSSKKQLNYTTIAFNKINISHDEFDLKHTCSKQKFEEVDVSKPKECYEISENIKKNNNSNIKFSLQDNTQYKIPNETQFCLKKLENIEVTSDKSIKTYSSKKNDFSQENSRTKMNQDITQKLNTKLDCNFDNIKTEVCNENLLNNCRTNQQFIESYKNLASVDLNSDLEKSFNNIGPYRSRQFLSSISKFFRIFLLF